SLRALRIITEAAEDLGETARATTAIDGTRTRLRDTSKLSADDIAEGVRTLLLASRRGPGNLPDFNALMAMLGEARKGKDPLSWRVALCEAQLLWDKDNPGEAVGALEQALSLNPKAAESWALFVQVTTAQMDVPAVMARLEKLDELAGGKSLDGLLALARLRLYQRDAASATEIIDSVLTLHPAQREALAMRAAAAASLFDDAATQRDLAAFAKAWPGSAAALVEVGLAQSGARQYEDAEKTLRAACAKAPGWAEAWTELGLVLAQAGRDDAARESLAEARRLDPFNVRAANTLTMLTELAGFATIESEHFIVRYKPGDDLVLAREMPATLERIYTRVTGNAPGGIDHAPAGKTVIDLMPDHAMFAVRITGMPQLHTIAAATGPLVAMEAPRVGAGHSTGVYDWSRVIQHEFTHTVTLSRTKNRLPHWFTEASAVYLEDAPRDESRCTMLARALDNDQLFDLDAINVAFSRPQKPQDRGMAYAQGHWMYEFIVEKWGAAAPLKLMDQYAAGVREAQAMESVLAVSREKFLEQFKSWARAQVVSWGLAMSDGVPSVKELLAQSKADGGSGTTPTPELIDAWMKEYPDHPQVIELAVAAALDTNAGKADDAMVPLLERLASAAPVKHLPHRVLAKFYLDKGEGEKAIPHLEFMDAREVYNPAIAVELSKRYAALDQWETAFQKAERATRIAPYDAAHRELAAAMAIKAGHLDAAARHIDALTILEPDRDVHRKRLDAVKKLMQATPPPGPPGN
ncbi:MAG: hypothetical protein JNL50_13330, partial [Phycisphaerae bacterium]|nr:hypothetical protein [Phycisphaerae bacterium]